MIAIPRFPLRVQFHHLVLSTFADNNTVDIRAFLECYFLSGLSG
jgi:hypothetical protein